EEYSVSLEKAPAGCALCWDVSVADRGIYKELLFFFSLLKRKKEAKKEKLTAYPYLKRQCITRLAV
ncbi:hypothetical protein, partial [Ruminococcus sp.]|uniref:hypothetical protein n=1 Tax=Ruminococcus sp. TaxID=41978 RepID=UPI003FD7BA20